MKAKNFNLLTSRVVQGVGKINRKFKFFCDKDKVAILFRGIFA